VHIAVMPRVQEQIHAVEHRSTLVGFDFFGFRDKLQAEVKAPCTNSVLMLRTFPGACVPRRGDRAGDKGSHFSRALAIPLPAQRAGN
jgi:hypothetical protein